MIFEQTILNKKTKQLLVEAEAVLVCLTKDFKPTQIPEDIKACLS